MQSLLPFSFRCDPKPEIEARQAARPPMAKQVTVPFSGLSHSDRAVRFWSELLKKPVSPSKAKDLDLAFSGGPAESNLGEEPNNPIRDDDDDEEPQSKALVARENQTNRARKRPLARGAIRSKQVESKPKGEGFNVKS